MKIAEHSIVVNGSLQAAWDKLLDWNTMPDWDIFMKTVHFDGPLAVGSSGGLILKNGQQFKLHITQLDHMNDYTSEFSTMGTRFIFYHQLTQLSSEKIKMHFSIDCEGLLSFLVHRLLRKEFESKLAVLMENFKDQLEQSAP